MPEQTAECIINVNGLTKQFYGRNVVNNISLQVNKGDIYGFLGPNGSGKTTTIRMLCGLLPIDGGEGTCLGFDIVKQSRAIKQKVGYMTQKFSLYNDLSVEQNLRFFARLFGVNDINTKVAKKIEQLRIGQARKTQIAGTLSGGWKQRLALAVATIHDPELLLLDEPTAGVDPKARREFWDEIFALSEQGITTLVSTHYMDEAERCNKLGYIAYGDLLINGTSQAVIERSGLQTWLVTGENLASLTHHLRQEATISQVSAFGANLHVSALKNQDLSVIIQQYQQDYHWQQITPSLEDVFIHLMQENQDNFA